MARSKVGDDVLQVRFPDGTFEAIDAVSSNRSDFIRGAVKAALDGPVSESGVSTSGSTPSAAVADVEVGRVRKYPKPARPQRQVNPEALRMRDEFRRNDKEALLELVRGGTFTSLQAERALGVPGLRYRNAEAELMSEGVLWASDGVLETLA